MSAPLTASPELAASLQRMLTRRNRDDQARAFEDGTARTKPAAQAVTAPRINPSRYVPRQRQRSPNRQASRDRRRRLGGSSALPDTLRHHYTEGQRAVLCIIAGEIKRQGQCDLPIDKIAALAGVCRTTVQTTLHEARRLDHITITERPMPGRKHLTNLIRIASAEWRAWLKRGPSAHRLIGSKPLILASTTKSREARKGQPSEEVLCSSGTAPPPARGSCGGVPIGGHPEARAMSQTTEKAAPVC